MAPFHDQRCPLVSAHSDVIANIAPKEVLYRTAKISWGSDIQVYTELEAMQADLPTSLASKDTDQEYHRWPYQRVDKVNDAL